MKYTYIATVNAIFEMSGDNNDAQTWVLSKLEPLGSVMNIEIVKWLDVYKNEPILMERTEGKLSKFSVKSDIRLVSDGGYAEAQKTIVDALKEDGIAKYININRVYLTRSINHEA